jgi:hypothetical protein
MIDDLAPIDDELVTAFRRILARARFWNLTREVRNDAETINEEAAMNVGDLRDLVICSGLANQLHHRFRLEAASDDGAHPDWSDEAKEARRLLLGAVRIFGEFGPALMPGWCSMALVADCFAMANGDPPLTGARIPAPNRRSKRPLLGDQLKAQIARLSHYNAGLKGTSWEMEMALIYGAGDGTLREWNRLISDAERQTFRRVGALMRSVGSLIDADDRDVRDQAILYTIDELRAWLKELP